ncbi:Tap42 interacting protein, partial [Mycoemilia scoparia]
MADPKNYSVVEDSDKGDGIRSISINGWNISTKKRPILENKEIEEYSKILGFNVPEMIFGNNYLTVKHGDKEIINLNALDALKMVDTGPDSAKKVQ